MTTRGGVEDTRLEAKAKDTKKSEAKAKDSLSEDRHSRGQGQECSRPRPRTKDTSASALQKKNNNKVFTKIFQAISKKKKKKKRSSQKFFKRSHTKKRFLKYFSSAPQNFNNSKNSAVLEPRTGQFSRTRGQNQGLDLRGQGQGLQNVSSRTSSRPRTSSRTPPLVTTLQGFGGFGLYSAVLSCSYTPLFFLDEGYYLKRYCSRSALLKKYELLNVIKRCPKFFFTITLIRENRFDPFDSTPLTMLRFEFS